MENIPNGNKKKNKKELIQALSLLTQMGLTMAVTFLICIMIGKFLDEKLGTSPFLLLIFSFFGFIASFREMYLLLKRYWNK